MAWSLTWLFLVGRILFFPLHALLSGDPANARLCQFVLGCCVRLTHACAYVRGNGQVAHFPTIRLAGSQVESMLPGDPAYVLRRPFVLSRHVLGALACL